MTQPLLEVKKLESGNTFSNRFFRFGLALICFELLSGIWLLLETGYSFRVMAFVLGHTLLGYFLVFSLIMFFKRHRLYRLAWPSKFYDFLAFVNIFSLLIGIVSGIWIHWYGYAGAKWVWWTHLGSTFLFVFALAGYILLTILKGKKNPSLRMRSLYYRQLFRIFFGVILTTVLLLGGFEFGRAFYKPPSPNKSVNDYSMSLQVNNLFFPSSLRTASNGFYHESFFTNSLSCGGGGCHNDSVRQWEESTHHRTPGPFVRRAEQLLIEEGDSKKLFDRTPSSHFEMIRDAKPGREVFRLCAGCHAPVALLSGHVDPKQPLETFEKFEGVSCKLCHLMDENPRPVSGAGNYKVTAAQKLLFEDSSSPLGKHLYQTLIRARPEDHKNMFSLPGYKSANICSSCHFTNQFESWQKSPYHDPQDLEKTKSCQNCHMPQEPSSDDISAQGKGTLASHRFPSAGFTMAQYFGLSEQFEKTKAFIQDKKMKIELYAPEKILQGKPLSFFVRVTNIGVGHFFPAGPEVELVESWVQVDVLDESDRAITHFGKLDQNNYLDEKMNKIWRGTNYDSHGRVLEQDRHRSWRFSKDELTVIPPKQYDEVTFKIPSVHLKKAGHFKIKARLMYRRPNQSFADWVLGKGKFKVPSVEIASTEKTIFPTFSREEALQAENQFRIASKSTRREYSKIQERPIVTSRTVVEDGLKVQNAILLSQQGRTKEALLLLDLVSPALLQESSWTKKQFDLLHQDISSKAKKELDSGKLGPDY